MSRALALVLALCALVAPSVAQAQGRLNARVPARASGPVEASGGSRVGSRDFLQRDPEGFVDSVNVYAAMANDPVNNRDPTGRETAKEFAARAVRQSQDPEYVPPDPDKVVLQFGALGVGGYLCARFAIACALATTIASDQNADLTGVAGLGLGQVAGSAVARGARWLTNGNTRAVEQVARDMGRVAAPPTVTDVVGSPAGAHGGLSLKGERPTPRMFNQEQPKTCGAACARQLAFEKTGVDVGEAAIVAQNSNYDALYGSGVSEWANATNAAVGRPVLRGGGVTLSPEELARALGGRPFAVRLGRHTVIVDEITSTDVIIRDPWGLRGPASGQGSIGRMSLEDFKLFWRGEVIF